MPSRSRATKAHCMMKSAGSLMILPGQWSPLSPSSMAITDASKPGPLRSQPTLPSSSKINGRPRGRWKRSQHQRNERETPGTFRRYAALEVEGRACADGAGLSCGLGSRVTSGEDAGEVILVGDIAHP